MCITIASLMMQCAATAEDGANVDQDWVLSVKTEELQRHFDYDRSGLKKIAKATVEYYHESDKDNVRPYQRLYYNSGKPIGLERTGSLELPPAKTVVIKVNAKDDTSAEEQKATANILWRLSLSIAHQKCGLISATVPDKAFEEIAQELENLGFTPRQEGVDQRTQAKAKIGLQSEPPGKTKSLFYY